MDTPSAVFLGSIALSLLRSKFFTEDNLSENNEMEYIVVQGGSDSYVDLSAFSSSSSSSSSSGGGGLVKGSFPSDISLGFKFLLFFVKTTIALVCIHLFHTISRTSLIFDTILKR